MQWLIDGYNLMHATGAAGQPSMTPDVFQKRRRRFLAELADGLGTQAARETTVVFDANSPPRDFNLESIYKGMRIIFALGDENADARIEQLIDSHSAPKGLTVVSSDRRVRQAARRSRARALTSEEFLDRIDRSRFKRPSGTPGAGTEVPEAEGRSGPTSPEESLYWIEQFRDLEAMPEIREVAATDAALITDAEIERIRREIDREP